PDNEEQLSNDILGVDLGITNIATDDSGKSYEGKSLNQLRSKRQKVRSSLQSKGTRGAKKVLKRISGRERTTTKIINHTIAKAIVAKAKQEQKAIALEELKGIRSKTNKRLRKSQRGLHNRWSFYQLRQFIEYKAKREGVQVITIPAAYTSKTCNSCFHIGNRSGESFKCTNCGNSEHADVNGAKNIRSWGRTITRPEKSALFCEYVSFVGHVRQV
ncbi:MAG: RNA-guided endonuclease InsQ/TnpB family protein, partial [Cyclobacteriaceae bacterium]